MSESTIIWKFLTREFPDAHNAIYLYVCGSIKNQQTAIDILMRICRPIFSPPMTEQYIKTVIKGFLDDKKKQYVKGEIRVKPFYH